MEIDNRWLANALEAHQEATGDTLATVAEGAGIPMNALSKLRSLHHMGRSRRKLLYDYLDKRGSIPKQSPQYRPGIKHLSEQEPSVAREQHAHPITEMLWLMTQLRTEAYEQGHYEALAAIRQIEDRVLNLKKEYDLVVSELDKIKEDITRGSQP